MRSGNAARGAPRGRSRPAGYAGDAGIVATFAVALAGLLVGAFAAYMGGERGAAATASSAAARALEDEAQSREEAALEERDRIVARIVAGGIAPERLTPPRLKDMRAAAIAPAGRAQPGQIMAKKPKIVIIIDDMGVDRRASEAALALPGPVTYSFLPYGRFVEASVEQARAAGGEIMLHLPMEPRGVADPGPRSLKTGMTGGAFLDNLEWNLTRFDGYVGVNNHMGSKLTADLAAMKTLLGHLDHRKLFFLDSLTTDQTAVREAAREIGVRVFARDVFLDDRVGDKASIREQLALAERIAQETGYVVAIGHPRKETLEVLGPWMTSAPARGFELSFASELSAITSESEATVVAAAPALRL